MTDQQYIMVAFDNAGAAMTAEAVLRERGIIAAVMPTLREITLCCGLSLRFHEEELDAVSTYIHEALPDIDAYRFYFVTQKDGCRTVSQMESAACN